MNTNNSRNPNNPNNSNKQKRNYDPMQKMLERNSNVFKKNMGIETRLTNINAVKAMESILEHKNTIVKEIQEFESNLKTISNEYLLHLPSETKRKFITKLNSLIGTIYQSGTDGELSDSAEYFKDVIALLESSIHNTYNVQNGSGKETSKKKKDIEKKIREELSSHLDKKVVDRLMRQINKMNSL